MVNQAILKNNMGAPKKSTPGMTYGSYVSGASHTSPAAPTPVTSSSNTLKYSALTPASGTASMPNVSYGANAIHIGAEKSKYSGGLTDEGAVIGGGAVSEGQIRQSSSGGIGSTSTQNGMAGGTSYGSSAGISPTMNLPEQNTYAESDTNTGTVESYEQYLLKKQDIYNDIRNQQTAFYDEQRQKTLDAIEEQRQAAVTEANNQKTLTDNAIASQKDAAVAEADRQRDLLINMSEEQKKAVYDFAKAQHISDMDYAARQYQLLVDSINAQKDSGMAMASEQRDLLLGMSEEQRKAAYKYAEEQRSGATEYANSQYQTLVDAINQQRELGMAMTEEQRRLLLSMSEEQRDAVYKSAEIQRTEAERRADTERERSVVDARSSYEQNKASYGMNAETMGSMGLSGSGYSDYLTSRAYAQQRAQTQAANAQSDASKREARYAENQSRLKADSDYYQNRYNAEKAYSDRKYDIDTSYSKNMLSANQNKAQSIYEAEAAERNARYSADSAHSQNEYSAKSQYNQNKYDIDTTYRSNMLSANQDKAYAEHEADRSEMETKFNADRENEKNKYAAESAYSNSKYNAESSERDAKLQSDLSYSGNIFNAESNARSDKNTAEQTADAGRFGADMSYQENILNNNDNLAKYRLEQEQKKENEANYARTAYTELLSGANTGAYTTEQLNQLSDDYGLSDAQRKSLIKAADDYTAKKQASANGEISDGIGNTFDAIDSAVQTGYLSAEQAAKQKAQIQNKNYEGYANDIAEVADLHDVSSNQIKNKLNSIDRAFRSGEITEEHYNSLKAQWNDSIDTSQDFFYAENTILTKSTAQKVLNNLFKNSWCSQDVKEALQSQFDKLYTPKIGGAYYGGDTRDRYGNPEENFKVTLGGAVYHVKYVGGECTDENVKEVAEEVGNDSMFGYQGHVYIKRGGNIYEIEKKKGSYQGSWDGLKGTLCG